MPPQPRRSPADTDDRLLPRLTVRQLTYVTSVAQHETIAGAAAALGIAAAAISAAVAQVEATAGVQLFERRHARGMVLTVAGRELVAEARSLLAALRELETAHRRDRPLAGRLHIGCILSVAPYLMPPVLRAFDERHPELELRCREGDQEALLRDLETGRLDAALLFDFDMPSTVRGVPLRALPLQVVLPHDHGLARGAPPTLPALAAEPLVLLDLPHSRDYFLAAFAEHGIAPRIVHRVQSPDLVRGLVAQGLGYALLNFCPPVVLPGQPPVVSIPLASPVRSTSLVFARPYRARTSRRLDALLAVAAEHAAALAIATGR
jgi:DNA-binding transcriptional LysR family regulator